MKPLVVVFGVVCCLLAAAPGRSAEVPVSDATQECLDCHASIHPGIVADWRASRHAAITPAAALGVEGLARKVSAAEVPEALGGVVVGCAECHLLRASAHADTFEHNGHDVHVVVSPDDCRTCHAVEADQYGRNIMAHARGNLADNALYGQLQQAILGSPKIAGASVRFEPPDADTQAEACFYCHGTELKVEGTEVRDTDAGELEFPIIAGWPNQGVGRVNLDGSKGACSACHTRHAFSIQMARKPHTCMECHVGPDVPAYKVYLSSKHGNVYAAMHAGWDFQAVPWTVGRDFTAPTCAVCHVSLVVNADGITVTERSHEMKDRLAWRIFGLVYAHPQPISPDTSVIRNRSGQPLPTDLDGGLAEGFLISPEEQLRRTEVMQGTCRQCHGTAWVEGHWRRYRNTIERSNESVRVLTSMMQEAWKRGLAQGPDQQANPFDEALERRWSDVWLFYGNTVRFAAAMGGGGDYGVFADGRYQLTSALIDFEDQLRRRLAGAQAPGD